MAELIWNDVEIIINAVDLSDHVRAASLTYGVELLEITAMGDTSRERIAGYKDWTLDVEFNQDFAASEVDATLFPLVGAAAFAVSLMPVKTGGVGATNPKYSGNALLETYPFGGSVGEVATTSVTFQGAGALTRATA